MRARIGAFVAAAAVVAVLGCGAGGGYGGGGGSPAPAQCTAATATPIANGTVTISGLSYSPACATVRAGTVVTFVNTDSVYSPHTVTWDAGQAVTDDSGPLANGAHFQHTFGTAGTERIHCTFHVAMGMRMTVFVQ